MFFALNNVVKCAEATESYLDDLRNKTKELSKEGLKALFSALDFIKAELIAGCTTTHKIEDILLLFTQMNAAVEKPAEVIQSTSPSMPIQDWSPNVAKSGIGFVRVCPQLLEQSPDQMGEISIFRAILRAKYPNDGDITNLTERLNFLQNSILKMRMERIDAEFQKYTLLARDLAQSLNKKIKLTVQESAVEVDRIVIAALSEPMIHLLRNCADHGIEDSEQRVQMGKPAVGTIFLQAAQHPGIMETLNHEGTIVRVIDVDYLANLQLPESARIRTKSLNGLIALVADDSSFFRSLLLRYLSELGVSVITAVNGRDAYNTLLQMNPKPNFILSDLTMPEMNGLEFIQQMRSHREFAAIPALAVSTIRGRSEIAWALEVGFDDYEVKVNRESLIKKIQQITASHNARLFQDKSYSKAS
jgi:CheY-like chemotaxis protein